MDSIVDLRPDRLMVDPSLQPRVGGLDAEHVRALQEAPEGWPLLLVVQRDGQFLLVDGFHRLAAAQNLGLETIHARVVAVPADGDLHALAFSANAAHGRPLSLADRRAFAERLLRSQPRLADREIGRQCGLSSNTVGVVRKRLEDSAKIEQTTERVGRGGYSYTVGTNEEKRRAGELPEAGFEGSVGEAVGELFTSAERKKQRRLVRYLQRLAVALEDQYELEGWETHEEAAESCRLVLGEERAAELAKELGDGADNVLRVAFALGYEDVGGTA